jgi:uncharacterized repeat protein (TIGR03843 family)
MSMPAGQELVLEALHKGDISMEGQFLRGSNYTFLANLVYQGKEMQVVYKPSRGEQPLWDFPTGTLARREVAAYLVSEAAGWHMVPPTIYRRNAPLGPGSIQQYIEHDPSYHYFNFEDDDRQRLRPVMLFDSLINNADRKGSHIFLDTTGKIWLIDHGLCFHVDDKLRTVIWDFAGESIAPNLLDDLRRLLDCLVAGTPLERELLHHLSRLEIDALISRGRHLLNSGCFTQPPRDRRTYPWPPL